MEKSASADHARSGLRLGTMARPERCFGATCRFDSKPCTTAIASASSGANEALPTKVFSGAEKVEGQVLLFQGSYILSNGGRFQQTTSRGGLGDPTYGGLPWTAV